METVHHQTNTAANSGTVAVLMLVGLFFLTFYPFVQIRLANWGRSRARRRLRRRAARSTMRVRPRS